jgi:hypothetical protein
MMSFRPQPSNTPVSLAGGAPRRNRTADILLPTQPDLYDSISRKDVNPQVVADPMPGEPAAEELPERLDG